jgi:hypothetical protein
MNPIRALSHDLELAARKSEVSARRGLKLPRSLSRLERFASVALDLR